MEGEHEREESDGFRNKDFESKEKTKELKEFPFQIL